MHHISVRGTKVNTEGRDPTPLLGLIELSARLNGRQVRLPYGTVHPDVLVVIDCGLALSNQRASDWFTVREHSQRPCERLLSCELVRLLQQHFEFCSTLAGAGFFFRSGETDLTLSGYSVKNWGRHALTRCMCRPTPVKVAQCARQRGSFDVPSIHVEGVCPLLQ